LQPFEDVGVNAAIGMSVNMVAGEVHQLVVLMHAPDGYGFDGVDDVTHRSARSTWRLDFSANGDVCR
jgi:hypothetical protein